MIITIVAWIYITGICYGWGHLIFRSAEKITSGYIHEKIPFSIVCFTGLAGIAGIAGVVSLFSPLGLWQLQLFFILPCIPVFYTIVKNSPSFNPFLSLHPLIIILLISSFIMVLIMSTWTISHPDSMEYHIQAIQWIEKYKAIPGLAHLNIHLGLQNLWFPVCALLSFHFTTMGHYFFLNAVVVIWYFYFVLMQINTCLYERNFARSLPWLALLALSIWSYTQTRLTVTSASPDFIVALYLWLIFYLLQNTVLLQHSVKFVLLIILTCFVICIKLSALPVIIVALYAAWKLIITKKVRALYFTGSIVILIFCSLLARNIITTGYPLFPSSFPDIANRDWKLKKTEVVLIKNYITTYARTESSFSKDAVKEAMQLTPSQWLPVWWDNRSTADKTIMLFFLGAIAILLTQLKNIKRTTTEEIKILLITNIAGIFFWFVQAPDPRFGFGFLIPFMGLAYLFLLKNNAVAFFNNNRDNRITGSLITGCIILTFYIGYRYTNYFSVKQIVQPLGTKKLPYHQISYSGITLNIPEVGTGCGDISVPCCAENPSRYFILRGSAITDGFRSVP
ncbi:LIC_10190 family membrane protein [Agriterribacter humi]|uniref:LIC_10190 family membrane protein n=1 Tax=Agriterribacter humi TaxID=1104781 RepID=UPI0012647B5E|nr:hypothetical protein [Agriterribacter humi]